MQEYSRKLIHDSSTNIPQITSIHPRIRVKLLDKLVDIHKFDPRRLSLIQVVLGPKVAHFGLNEDI